MYGIGQKEDDSATRAIFTCDRKVYERALIYHDAGAVAFFGDQIAV